MKELAEFLKNQRIDSNLTVEAISRLSGISVSMLESFESFDFERFGACILLRNTVRAYCDALHLDADALMEKYSSQIEACNLQAEGLRRYGRLQKTIHKRRRMVALPVFVFFLAAVTVYCGGMWISKRRSKLFAPPNANKIFSQDNLPVELQQLPKSAAKTRLPTPAPQQPMKADRATKNTVANNAANTPAKTVGKPEAAAGAANNPPRLSQKAVGKPQVAAVGSAINPPRAPQKTIAPDGKGAVAQLPPGGSADAMSGGATVSNADAHTLNRFTVEADHKAWVQVKIDGQKASSVMLHPGDRKEWVAAKSLQVVIGNAGGVHMQWNGQPLKAPRVAGRVLRFSLPEYAKSEKG